MSTDVVLARLDLAPDIVAGLGRCLSPCEQSRAGRFHFERDRRRFIVARGRLRHLLGERLNKQPERVTIQYGARGKPAVDGLHFNLSHTGDYALYAFSTDGEVGVDLETIRPLPEADAIAATMFSPAEVAEYEHLAPDDRTIGFFNCWTRKEAFVKALGDGLAMPLDRFDVTLAPGAPARLMRVGEQPGAESGWQLHGFSPARGLIAALVTRH